MMQRQVGPGRNRIAAAYAELPDGREGTMYYETSPEEGIVPRTMYILGIPAIATRCIELTRLIKSTHIIELREVYPLLLQDIFGWESSPGWNLRHIKRELSAVETQEIMKMLKPNGTLIELAYHLMRDPKLFYEFPAHALPAGFRNDMTNSRAKPYDTDVHYATHSSSIPLPLSPFELFFCHYANAEVRQQMESSEQNPGLGLGGHITDSIYTDLLEEYLNFFVPASEDGKIPAPLTNTTVYRSSKPNYTLTPTKTPPSFGPNSMIDDHDIEPPTIFKPSVFQNDGIFHDQSQFSPQKHPVMDSDFWRTETVLSMLISMWLSGDDQNCGYKFATKLPTVELVKSVRIFVRHWHLLSNVINRSVNHPLEDLVRSIHSEYQKRIYHFLRFIIPRWPLDASFRIVYETWLSYIQPWRYTQMGFGSFRGADPADLSVAWNLDAEQCNFVLENLPFYTCLFQHILERLTRADLSALRNAHMLYRITKVFCGIENLRVVLYEIEKRILTDSSLGGSSCKWYFGDDSSIPLLDSSSFFPKPLSEALDGGFASSHSFTAPRFRFVPSNLKLTVVKKMMADWEGYDTYVPMFSRVNREKVIEIIENATVILQMCEPEPPPAVPEFEPERNGFWDKIIRMLSWKFAPTKEGLNYDSQPEITKRVNLLMLSRNNLIQLFNLTNLLPIASTVGETQLHNAHFGLSDSANGSPGYQNSWKNDKEDFGEGNGVCFIPRGTIPGGYLDLRTGNPDTCDALENEIRIMVDLTKRFSYYVNRWVITWSERIYFSESWKGRLCRAVLARPEHYYELKKVRPGQMIRDKKYLPPRLNFRFLASTKAPIFILLVGLICWFCGLHGVSLALFPIGLAMVYIFLRAMLEPTHFLDGMRYDFSADVQRNRRVRHSNQTIVHRD